MQLSNLNIDEHDLSSLAEVYHITEMYLFGSALRSDFHQDSDIDIMIVVDQGYALSYPDLCEMKEMLESIMHRRVDLVEKAGIINPYRQAEIFSTAVKIYAA